MIAGFFSAIGIMIIYLRLENPERFLDSDTGFFNRLAFKRYMRQVEETGNSIAILYIDYRFDKVKSNDFYVKSVSLCCN